MRIQTNYQSEISLEKNQTLAALFCILRSPDQRKIDSNLFVQQNIINLIGKTLALLDLKILQRSTIMISLSIVSSKRTKQTINLN